MANDMKPLLGGIFGEASGGEGWKGVGKNIADVVNTITQKLSEFMKWLSENPKVAEFGVALAGVGVAALGFGLALDGILLKLMPVLKWIASGIGIISKMGFSWNTVGALLRPIVTNLFPSLSKVIIFVAKNAVPALSAAWKILSGAFGIFRTVVLPVLQSLGLLNPIFLGVVAILAILYLAWTNNWFGIRDITYKVVDWIRVKLVVLSDKFREVKDDIIEAWNNLPTKFEEVKQSISNSIDYYKAKFEGWKTDVNNAVQGVIDKFWEMVGKVTSYLEGISFEGIFTKITDLGKKILGIDDDAPTVANAVSFAINAITFGGALGTIAGLVLKILGIDDDAPGVATSIANTINGISFAGILGKIEDVKKALSGMIQTAKDAYNEVMGYSNKSNDAKNNVTSTGTPSLVPSGRSTAPYKDSGLNLKTQYVRVGTINNNGDSISKARIQKVTG